MIFKKWLVTFGVFALAACGQPAQVDYKAEIEAANDRFEEVFAAGDGAAMVAFYTDDSVIIPPGMDTAIGAEAQASLWQGLMDSGIKTVDLVTLEVSGEGNMAGERGAATLYDADGNVAGTIRYVVVWKKVGDIWKLHLDTWN